MPRHRRRLCGAGPRAARPPEPRASDPGQGKGGFFERAGALAIGLFFLGLQKYVDAYDRAVDITNWIVAQLPSQKRFQKFDSPLAVKDT